MANTNKIDSNFTSLRYAEEAAGCIGILPGQIDPQTGLPTPGETTWFLLEPNSYGEFGPQIATVARTPIRSSRQQEKGVTTDLDAVANFQMDFTQDNMYDLMQGFFFADWRISATPEFSARDNPVSIDGLFDPGTGTTTVDPSFNSTADIGDQFNPGDIVLASGFVDPANNGAFSVISPSVGQSLDVENLDGTAVQLVAEGSNPNIRIKKVGQEFPADDISIDVASSSFPALVTATGDFTATGLIPGQWVFVGGDAVNSAFPTGNNNGYCRVRSVTPSRLEFDKTQNVFTQADGLGVALQIFFGDLIKNEISPDLIITRSYGFERSLSTAGFEYVRGCVANTFTFNVTSADKITIDLGFVGIDGFPLEQRFIPTAANPREATPAEIAAAEAAGAYPDINTSSTVFNTSADFTRIRSAIQGVNTPPLFAFITDLTITVNNNITPSKAVGTLGAFDVNIGDFVAEGNITAYFTDVEAQRAVRDNEDVTIDFAITNDNVGWVFDLPLLTLGEGRLNVTKDEPITIPVSIGGARDPFLNTTLQAVFFAYAPDRAEG